MALVGRDDQGHQRRNEGAQHAPETPLARPIRQAASPMIGKISAGFVTRAIHRPPQPERERRLAQIAKMWSRRARDPGCSPGCMHAVDRRR